MSLKPGPTFADKTVNAILDCEPALVGIEISNQKILMMLALACVRLREVSDKLDTLGSKLDSINSNTAYGQG